MAAFQNAKEEIHVFISLIVFSLSSLVFARSLKLNPFVGFAFLNEKAPSKSFIFKIKEPPDTSGVAYQIPI